MIGASHPFQQRSLNALDENGNEGCARCGRTRDVHPGPVAVTPGPPPRDHYREQVHREFTGWAEAQGYAGQGRYDHNDMREAFTAGWEAADAVVTQPAPECSTGADRTPGTCAAKRSACLSATGSAPGRRSLSRPSRNPRQRRHGPSSPP